MIKLQKLRGDPIARERRLRRLVNKRGFTLVRPWAGERRKVGSLSACYVLVPHYSGLSVERGGRDLDASRAATPLSNRARVVHTARVRPYVAATPDSTALCRL